MSNALQAWALKQTTGSPTRKSVLLGLADHANGHSGKCNPYVETLAKELELGFRTVQRALYDLERDGFISRHRPRKVDGSWGAYEYSFPLALEASSPAAVNGSSHRPLSAHPVAATASQEEPEVKQPEVEPEGLSADSVQRVYDHWREARGKTRSNYDQMSPGRRKRIISRLREFPAADLIEAIDNVAKDPWPDRAMHDDITIIFRSREQVEKFLEITKTAHGGRSQTPLQSAESWVKTTGWQYPDADLWEELGRYELEPDQKRRLMSMAADLQVKPTKSFEMTGIVRDIP